MISSFVDRGGRCVSHLSLRNLPHCRNCHGLNLEYAQLDLNTSKPAPEERDN
jgi:hypothetical protein